jgi:hypothetical protein
VAGLPILGTSPVSENVTGGVLKGGYGIEFDSPAIVEEDLCLWLGKDLRITYRQNGPPGGGLLKSRVNDSEDAGGCITFCPIHSLYNVSISANNLEGGFHVRIVNVFCRWKVMEG